MEAVDDIEDMAGTETVADRTPHTQVLPKWQSFRKPRLPKEEPSGEIPGVGSVYVRTWGCSHNNSDGEYMAGQLAEYGYVISDAAEADVWVLNGCTVKNPSQDHFLNTVKKGRAMGKKIVLAGCVPQAQPGHSQMEDLSIIGVQQIDRVVEVVEETMKGNVVRLLKEKKVERVSERRGKSKARKVRAGGASLALPKIRRNPLVEIVPVNTGCLNQCTYCKTKHARGNLASYLPEEIYGRVDHVVNAEGVVEIWLTSEDTGTYGRDIGHSLPELLWGIVDLLPDGVMLRVGMTNPPYILEHLEEMARILSHPRVYAFLHVPVQAASNRVLERMKREYTQEEFCRVVDYLMKSVPGMTIATDIICGFPGETPEDFEATLQLVRRYKFPVLHISQFYPRPGTPAARMKRVDTAEVKRRSREMTKLFNSYETYSHRVGTRQRVLVTEESKDGKNFIAHNKSYEQVLVPKYVGADDGRGEKTVRPLMGKMFMVEIVESGKHFLKGKVVEESLAEMPTRPPVMSKAPQTRTLRKRTRPVPTASSTDTGACMEITAPPRHVQRTERTVGLAFLTGLLVILLLIGVLLFGYGQLATLEEVNSLL